MTVALPRALRLWRTALELFPPDLAVSLGRMLPKLARALGPLYVDTHSPEGEPDGYDGLARRGPLDRLLLSDLALSIEHPLEFTRRLTQNELSYLALARKGRAGSRQSTVLLGSGPSMLGAPRLAELLVLIALSARAEQAKLPFAFGFLEDDRRSRIGELSQASIRYFLRARTVFDARDDDLQQWLETLSPARERDDLWIVGHPALYKRLASIRGFDAASWVSIHESFASGPRCLELEIIRRADDARSEITLEVPPEAQAIRLLRDPFELPAPPPKTSVPLALSKAPQFAPQRRLLALDPDNGIVSFAVPGTTRSKAAAPTRFFPPKNEQIVGATWHSSRLVVVTQSPGSLVIHHRGKHGGPSGFREKFTVDEGFEIVLPPDELCPCIHWTTRQESLNYALTHETLLKDGRDRLVALSLDGPRDGRTGRAQIVSEAVSAIGWQSYWRCVAASNGELLRAETGRTLHKVGIAPVPYSRLERCWLGFPRKRTFLLAQEWGGIIHITHDGVEAMITPPPEVSIIGCGIGGSSNVGLFWIELDFCTVAFGFHSPEGKLVTQVVFRAPNAILHAVVSPNTPEIAVITVRGELRVFNVDQDEFTLAVDS